MLILLNLTAQCNDAWWGLQVQVMTQKWHVYMTKDGRISMAGLSKSSCEYLAQAIVDAVHSA